VRCLVAKSQSVLARVLWGLGASFWGRWVWGSAGWGAADWWPVMIVGFEMWWLGGRKLVSIKRLEILGIVLRNWLECGKEKGEKGFAHFCIELVFSSNRAALGNHCRHDFLTFFASYKV
jgi:hypothetical protein